jgi:hypothetical protein
VIHVTDALIISPYADGVVLVVKGGHTPREAVLRAKQALQDVNAKIFGRGHQWRQSALRELLLLQLQILLPPVGMRLNEAPFIHPDSHWRGLRRAVDLSSVAGGPADRMGG